MNGEQKLIIGGTILGLAVAVAFPQFIFGLLLGLGFGIAVEARYRWFVNKNSPKSQTEPTQLESVTITQKRVPVYQSVCRYCGAKLVGGQQLTKCPNCGANL